MYNQDPNQSLFNLRINDNMKIQLRGAAVLAGIAAILSLANTVLGLVNSFMEKKTAIDYQYEGFRTDITAQRSGSVAGSIIMLIISILLFYFLNRFASQTKKGLTANNPQIVTNGLGGLSSYFVTVGILLILLLILMLIVILAIL